MIENKCSKRFMGRVYVKEKKSAEDADEAASYNPNQNA